MQEAPRRAPLAVLRHRDYRLLLGGQIGSLIGSRMQGAALLWHLDQLTRDPGALGTIGLVRLIPLITLALVGGLIADSLDRRRLMLGCQTFMAILSAALGAATLSGARTPWMIYAVAALTAATMVFDGPARQSLLPTLVPRDELASAVSLNSLTTQLCAVLGPALMGWIIAQHSVGVVYCINAASFLWVIGALLLMRPVAATPVEARPKISFGAAIEGLRYVAQSPILLAIMLLDFVANLCASANTLLPVFAREILQVGPGQYGLLAGAQSVGALLAAGTVAVLPPIQRQGRVILAAVLLFGLATAAFGLSQTFAPAYLALAAIGATDTVSMVLRHTIRQWVTPDHLRGRMTSVNQLFVQGGPHLGELEAGFVARWFGTPFSIVSGGLACALAVAWFWVARPGLREYQRKESAEYQ